MHDYWKMKLNLDQRAFYEDMLSAFSKYKERVVCNGLAPHEISESYIAICNDHPELYQLPYNPQVAQSFGMLGRNSELIIHNIYDRIQIRTIDAKIEKVKAELLSCIPTNASSYEKEKAVCDYLIEQTTYEINNQFNQNVASVLAEHKGQCSGIAKAVKLMLGWLGIDSIVVNGYATDNATGTSGPHSWNIVWLDSKSYHLDVTFMLGANLNKIKPFRYLYLNYMDAEINPDHQWDGKGTPHCDSSWNRDQGQVRVSSVVENSRHSKTISSLYELKQELKAVILAGGHTFEFFSQIPVSDSALMRNISSACKAVLDSMGKALQMSISIGNLYVSISW